MAGTKRTGWMLGWALVTASCHQASPPAIVPVSATLPDGEAEYASMLPVHPDALAAEGIVVESETPSHEIPAMSPSPTAVVRPSMVSPAAPGEHVFWDEPPPWEQAPSQESQGSNDSWPAIGSNEDGSMGSEPFANVPSLPPPAMCPEPCEASSDPSCEEMPANDPCPPPVFTQAIPPIRLAPSVVIPHRTHRTELPETADAPPQSGSPIPPARGLPYSRSFPALPAPMQAGEADPGESGDRGDWTKRGLADPQTGSPKGSPTSPEGIELPKISEQPRENKTAAPQMAETPPVGQPNRNLPPEPGLQRDTRLQTGRGERSLPPIDGNAPSNPFNRHVLVPGDKIKVVITRARAGDQSYLLQTGDEIRVEYLHLRAGEGGIEGIPPEYLPSLDRTVWLQPDGSITLPYVTQVPAAGRTVTQLAKELDERYREFYWEPHMLITLLHGETQSRELAEQLRVGESTVEIGRDGMVVMPMLGAIPAAGSTAAQLRIDLIERYRRVAPEIDIELHPIR